MSYCMKNWRINWVAAAAARHKSQLSPQYCFKGEVAINFIRATQSRRGRCAASHTPRCAAASHPQVPATPQRYCLHNFPPLLLLHLMLILVFMWICFVISEEIEIFLMDYYVIVKYEVISTYMKLANAAIF